MCFWHAKSLSAAMRKAGKVVDSLSTLEQMYQKIDDNVYFVPSLLYRAQIENWKMAMIADEKWLYALFNFRFVFWKKYELLGMVGTLPEGGPEADGAVYFQNSCDQNYSLSEWPTSIPFFKEKVKNYEAMLHLKPKKCLKKLKKLGFTDEETIAEALEDGECTKDAAEYHVLSSLYHDIFDTLRLNTWLWGNDDKSFHRFSLNAIHTSERLYDLKRHLQKRVISERGNLGSMNIMFIPVTVQSSTGKADTTLLFKYAYSREQQPLSCDDAAKKIAAAVNKCMNTEDGKRLVAACDGHVTWKDIMKSIPAKPFKEYAGFELLHPDDFSGCVVFNSNARVDEDKNQTAPEPNERNVTKQTRYIRGGVPENLKKTAFWKRREKERKRKSWKSF